METIIETKEVEPNMKIKIEVISNSEEVVNAEIKRLKWYIDNYKVYIKKGYYDYLVLPLEIKKHIEYQIESGVDVIFPESRIRSIVEREYAERLVFYKEEIENLKNTWSIIEQFVLPEVEKLYGIKILTGSTFKLAPTSYGTGGGATEDNGTIHFRMPKFGFKEIKEGERDISRELYGLVHEVLCHALTVEARKNTLIDDSINTAKQYEKERLMDLIGRTLLIRSGLLKKDEVMMDLEILKSIGPKIDTVYYGKVNIGESEGDFWWEGDLKRLIDQVALS